MLHPAGLPAELAQLNRTLVMGVINVTPDSFSDGGKFHSADHAIAQGRHLLATGADIVDIGGESTRPGAQRISIDEELSRVIPVITALKQEDAVLSIDTMRADVAREAVAAGAAIVNDISGGKSDPAMLPYIATIDLPYIVMHWRGESTVMQSLTDYVDVAADVLHEVQTQVQAAVTAGVNRNRIAIDPGIGFAKTPDQNWPLVRAVNDFQSAGLPVLWGVSRKRFIGELLANGDELRPTEGREDATTAFSTYFALHDVWCVRVHNAQATRDAVEVVQKLKGRS